METFKLNNTGFIVGFPKSHIIRPSGDINAGPLNPDIYLNSNILTESNSELEALIELIR